VSFFIELAHIFGTQNVQQAAKLLGYSLEMPDELNKQQIDFKLLFAKFNLSS